MTEDNSAHHTKKTIIADLQIDLVEDVALDYMHLTCLGVMRKLICYWAKRDTVNHLIGKMQQRPFQTDYWIYVNMFPENLLGFRGRLLKLPDGKQRSYVNFCFIPDR